MGGGGGGGGGGRRLVFCKSVLFGLLAISYCWITNHIICFFIYLLCGLNMLRLFDLTRLLSQELLKAIFSYSYACLDKLVSL